MIGIFNVVWKVNPVTPPRPWKHCNNCGDSRPFDSSGKIRLNANGRRLDAWLIYKCASCDNTWNLRLLGRVNVTSVSDADLEAMHASDPDWVREREHNLAALKDQCDRIEFSSDLSVTKSFDGDWPQAWSIIVLTIDASLSTGHRLDRFLANELGLSRSAIQSMHRTGGLLCDVAGAELKKPVSGRFVVQFVAEQLTKSERIVVSNGLGPKLASRSD